MDEINVVLDPSAIMPTRAHDHDGGLDLYAPFFAMVPAGGRCVIDTGVHVGIPVGYVGKLESKSGLMRDHGITCRGTIDAGFTGSIKAVVFNHSDKPHVFEAGDKITQLVLYPIITPKPVRSDTLFDYKTDRGDGEFGSSGR